MSFYKWYREVGYLGDDQNARAKIAYEAGAQSRQAEIDGLIDMVKTSADSEMYLFEELQRVNKELETLQGMHDALSLVAGDLVERADKLIYEMRENYPEILDKTIDSFEEILKGNKND